MNPREIKFTCASFKLGLGNQGTLACLYEKSIVTTGPLTILADQRQQSMTHNPSSAEKYTANQTEMRGSLAAKLLGFEGLLGILSQTPRLKTGELRALITSSELYYLPIINQLHKRLSPYFTHLMLVVADVAPKPSALKLLQLSQKSNMPITPIVFANSISQNLTSIDVPNILVSPILNFQTINNHEISGNVIKESGTGLDHASRVYFQNAMKDSPQKLYTMDANQKINLSQALSLKEYYEFLYMYKLGMVGTHASEMIGALTGNLPSDLYLARARGLQEGFNADWMALHYDEIISSPGQDIQIRHLRKRKTTEEEIADAIGHTRAMTAIDRFIRQN